MEKIITQPPNQMYEKIAEDYAKGVRKIKAVFFNGSYQNFRLGRTAGGDIIYLAHGSRSRGRYLYPECGQIQSYSIPRVDIERDWSRSIAKAILLLEKSGLWPNILQNLKTARDIGYSAIARAYEASNYSNKQFSYDEVRKERTRLVGVIEPRLIKSDSSINTSILWYMSKPLKIEKMRFVKDFDENEQILRDIKKAMKDKKPMNIDYTFVYDVSFEYSPSKRMAWFSKEFRGCGNGHYYLALDSTYAMFSEDD